MDIKSLLKKYWPVMVTWAVPVILLPIIFIGEFEKSACGYMLLVMSVFWVTDCIPLGVTGLIPIMLSPMLGILTLSDTCQFYMSDAGIFFFGTFVLALTIESSGLHKRIALVILHKTGVDYKWLLFGILMTTAMASMVISNTATVAVMLPIVSAILQQIHTITADQQATEQAKLIETEEGNIQDDIHKVPTSDDGSTSDEIESNAESYEQFSKAMTLMCSYGALCGGTAALTGTPANIIMKGYADQVWRSHGFEESPVTFASWLLLGFPVSLINLIFVWVWTTFHLLGIRTLYCKKETQWEKTLKGKVSEYIASEQKAMGSMKFCEYAVAGLFSTVVLLWFFRAPGFMAGWGAMFPNGYMGAASPTILATLLLFAIPKELNSAEKTFTPLITWPTIHKHMPWDLLFLLGGGLALAESCKRSGLSEWMGSQLMLFMQLNPWLLLIILCIISSFLTEFITNAATCSILMPVMVAMAEQQSMNPLFLMLPVAMACSFAYLLPVATPQNALVYATGRLRIRDMIKAGIVPNFFSIVVVTLATMTYGYAIFDFDTVSWKMNNPTSNATETNFNMTTIRG